MIKNESLNEKQYEFVAHWLYNAKIGVKNDCILFFSVEQKSLRDNIKNFLTGNIVISEMKSKNFKMPKNNDDRNLLVITDSFIPLSSIDLLEDKILFFKLYDSSDLQELLIRTDSAKKLPSLGNYDSSIFFIERRDPIEIVFSNVQRIKEFLFLIINDDYRFPMFDNLDLLMTSKGIKYSKESIKKDIEFLNQEQMLTARLGAIIYKLALLDLNADKSTIGRFYRQHIGEKSYNLNYKSWGIQNVKGYSLLKYKEDKIRLEIAQNLLNRFPDIENIPELTGLTLEQVNTLKTKFFNK